MIQVIRVFRGGFVFFLAFGGVRFYHKSHLSYGPGRGVSYSYFQSARFFLRAALVLVDFGCIGVFILLMRWDFIRCWFCLYCWARV